MLVIHLVLSILQAGLGDYSFLPFTVLLALSWVFLFKFLPETKNRTFEDITSAWRRQGQESDMSLSSNGSKDAATEESTLVHTSSHKTKL